jgi:predicted AAA+ superfamily ATPase
VSQSLAGRSAVLKLLPFSIREMTNAGLLASLDELIFAGFYPRLYDKQLDPTEALAFYVETYVERDLRSLLQVRNLRAFEQFLKLCATFSGQVLNLSKIASACGIDQKTASAWMSVLEASFLVFLLPPHHNNLKKRVVKSPKLYFVDTGLACFLLGIKNPGHVATHPLRGALFEGLVICDLLKERYHAVQRPDLYFYKAHAGTEVELLVDHGTSVTTIEIKSSQTLHSSYFDAQRAYQEAAGRVAASYLVYAGTKRAQYHDISVLPWASLPELCLDPD